MNNILSTTILFLLVSLNAKASTIYSCKLDKEAQITWETASFFGKDGMVAKASDSVKQSLTVTLVVEAKKATLKGQSQVPLVKITDKTFFEETLSGNIIMWTLIKGADGIPTYLYSQKAYDFMGPAAFSASYKCN